MITTSALFVRRSWSVPRRSSFRFRGARRVAQDCSPALSSNPNGQLQFLSPWRTSIERPCPLFPQSPPFIAKDRL